MLVKGRKLEHINGRRSGVIFYTVHKDQLWFLLAIDRKTRDLTDFGGGCKADETLIEGGLRESTEESCEIFPQLTRESLLKSIAVTNQQQDTAIFFVAISDYWLDHAESLFTAKQKELPQLKKYQENVAVKWYSDTDFRSIVFDPSVQCMWKRIQHFISTNVNFISLNFWIMFRHRAQTPSVKNDDFFSYFHRDPIKVVS